MPRDEFKPLLEREQKFVYHFARNHFIEERLNLVERTCRMKPGEGKLMLRRKHVVLEINRRKAAIEFEENRQIAKDHAVEANKEHEAAIVTPAKLEKALDGIVGLEAKDHAPHILKAIELGLIYIGKMRDGNRIRMHELEQPAKTQPDGEEKPQEDGFYRSIFAGLEVSAAPGPAQQEPVPLMPEGPPPEPAKQVLKIPAPPRPTAALKSTENKGKPKVTFT